MEFNALENDISEWLEDLKKVFEEILKEELPPHRDEVDHEITLKIEKIKPSLLILTRSKKQENVKEYLNEMIRKK